MGCKYEECLSKLHNSNPILVYNMRKSFIKGHELGRAEGRAEGEKRSSMATAKRMKQKGYSAEDIADMTGLPLEVIKEL